jgi:hypothetical protein
MTNNPRLVNIHHARRPLGHACLHCRRPATTRAEAVSRGSAGTIRRIVYYCDADWIEALSHYETPSVAS